MCARGGGIKIKLKQILASLQVKTQTCANLAIYIIGSIFRKTYICMCIFSCAMSYGYIEDLMATEWALRMLFSVTNCIDLSTL